MFYTKTDTKSETKKENVVAIHVAVKIRRTMKFILKIKNRVGLTDDGLSKLEKLGFTFVPSMGGYGIKVYQRTNTEFPIVEYESLDEFLEFIGNHGRSIDFLDKDENDTYIVWLATKL